MNSALSVAGSCSVFSRLCALLFASVVLCNVSCTGPSAIVHDQYARYDVYEFTEAIGFDDWAYVASWIGDNPNHIVYKGGLYASVLHYASLHGSTNIVTHLLRRGADKLSRDWSGQVPIQLAMFAGHTSVCELLTRSDVESTPRDDKVMQEIILDALWQVIRLTFFESDTLETLYLCINGAEPAEPIRDDMKSECTIVPFAEDFNDFVARKENPFAQPSLAIQAKWLADGGVDVQGVVFPLPMRPIRFTFAGDVHYGYGLSQFVAFDEW